MIPGLSHSQTPTFQSSEDGGPRRWVVNTEALDVYEGPDKSALVGTTYPTGTVLSNLGCKTTNGLAWCEVRPFRGGPKMYVQAGTLIPAQGPDGVVPMGPDTSKARARKRDFDETANVPCAQERGQSLGQCTASVARSGGGDATVEVAFSNGFKRQLYFVHGEFLRASATMSGVGTDIDWRLEADLHLIRVDDQRFEIPNGLLIEK